MSDKKPMNGMLAKEQTDYRLIFFGSVLQTVSEKTAEAAADEWQIIAAAFVGQEYRERSSLPGFAKHAYQQSGGLLIVEGEKSSAG